MTGVLLLIAATLAIVMGAALATRLLRLASPLDRLLACVHDSSDRHNRHTLVNVESGDLVRVRHSGPNDLINCSDSDADTV